MSPPMIMPPPPPVTRVASWAVAQATYANSAVNTIEVEGYYTAGDGGRARFARRAAPPSHPGAFQTADGAWWEMDETVLNFEQLGALNNGSASAPLDAYQAIYNTFVTANATAGRVRPRSRWYGLSATLDLTPFAALDFDGGAWAPHGPGSGTVSTSVPLGYRQYNTFAFVMLTDSIDGVRVGVTPCFRNCRIVYKNQQPASSTNIGFAWNRLVNSAIDNVRVEKAAISFGIPQTNFAGASGLYAASQNVSFACRVGNLYSVSASNSHYDLRSYGGAGTNLSIDMLYVSGGRSLGWGAAGQSCNYVVRAIGWSGLELGAISIDGVDCAVNMFDIESASVNIRTMRFEEGQMTADNKYWFLLAGSLASVNIGQLSFYNCRSQASLAANTCHIFRASATSVSLKVDAIWVGGSNSAWSGSPTVTTNGTSAATATTTTVRLLSMTAGLDGTLNHIDIGPVQETDSVVTGWNLLGNGNRSWSADTAYQRPPIRRYAGRRVSEITNPGVAPNIYNYIRYADSANDGNSATGAARIIPPTVADPNGFAWNAGDEIRLDQRSNPGAPTNFLCVYPSSIGTWVVSAYGGDYQGVTYDADASATVTPPTRAWRQALNTPLTAARSWTLSAAGCCIGQKLEISRRNGATGSYNLLIYDTDGSTLLATMPYSANGTVCTFVFGDTSGHWTRASQVISL